MLACRLCRVPLSATTGCTVCDPVRRNLVVVGEDEDDRPSLTGVAAELVAVLRGQVKQVRLELSNLPTDTDLEKRALSLGNTLSKVLESARKLQVDGKRAVEHLSFAERAELFITWVTSLPPVYRRSLTDRLAKWEADIARPQPEMVDLTS